MHKMIFADLHRDGDPQTVMAITDAGDWAKIINKFLNRA